MDSRDYIHELFKMVPIDSILVIDKKGEIKRIYCPFKVVVILPVGGFQPGIELYVEAIKITPELKDVYIIEWKAYYPFYFKIL